ncbi:O-antigen ligase family protein [Aureimonas leprariae]|uniref:O-antigen ligase family protein n=1 Tax=Plantimonas leprariae TaxID=2615207 RepID=UPI001386E240|nr:O-antigen ligase family protein [Aureimonas leprariae]
MLVFSLYAIYLVEFIPLQRLLKMLFIALLISCVVSLAMIVAMPALSLTTDERGAWRGAMQHKNGLGVTVAFAFTISLICGYLKVYPLKYVVPLALLALLLLKLANSATAILALAVVTAVIVIILFVVNRTRSPIVTLAFAAAGVGILAVVVLSSGILFSILGREGTLTGRADIWGFAWGMIAENPIWGYGQGAWTFEWMKKLAYAELGWPIAHAHNAWIDFRFQLGLPGVTLAVLMWAVATINLLTLIAKRQALPIVLPMAVFLLLSFRSYSETIIVDPALNDMFWFAFAVASFARSASVVRQNEARFSGRRQLKERRDRYRTLPT